MRASASSVPAQLGLPQVEDMMKRMGISPDDLEGLNNEMMQAFGGAEEMSDLPEGDGEDDEESGKTATFPFLNRLFGSGSPAEKPEEGGAAGGKSRDTRERKADKKKKYLDNYCINLTQRARDGKLDAVIGRDRGDRARRSDPQPPPEEQSLPHRRAGRRQDGHRRGTGPAHRRRARCPSSCATRRSTSST